MANTETKMSSKVVNYQEFTKTLQETFYPKLVENTPMLTCIRKTANGTFQVEFMERKPSTTSNSVTNGGLNLTFFINRGHDDRFKEFIKIERAWSTAVNRGALEAITGPLADEDFEALNSFEEGTMDRLRVMKTIPTLKHEGKSYQLHVAVTEVRQIELEEGSVALNNSQKQSLEHENSIKRTGGDNSELIVCSRTGSSIRKITEIKVFELGADVKDIDTTIPNQVLQSVFLGTPAANNVIVNEGNADDVAKALLHGSTND